jgi:hypothetical protein
MSRADTLFIALLCILLGAILGWSLCLRTQDRACEELLESAYKAGRAAGRATGLSEAAQNGSCLRWWTGASTEDLYAARAAFCKRK